MGINKIYQGDSLQVLKSLPDESVDMVMTSPPYWNLRDYGIDGQLGLEPTFEEYISKLCDIFDEVKRVLKKEGTCWVNIGDTYANMSTGGQGATGGRDKSTLSSSMPPIGTTPIKRQRQIIPEKSLCMIPSRFSIEMVNRGWILRNEIIWHKPNCMPESVKDRFTTDFEKLFFFVKSKKYYFNAQAVAEPITDSSAIRLLQDIENQKGSDRANGGTKTNGNMKAVGSRPSGWATGKDHSAIGWNTPENRKKFDDSMGGGGTSFYNHSGYRKDSGKYMLKPMRNKRTVWKIEIKGFSEAHFAVYPEKLCKTPILAGCPEGGIVLDLFAGAGTTLKVAKELFRNYIGIELNPAYIKIAEKRLQQEILSFASIV